MKMGMGLSIVKNGYLTGLPTKVQQPREQTRRYELGLGLAYIPVTPG
jgi:hypothetical protein